MQVLQGILDTLNNISREGLSMKALSDAPSGGGLSAADQALEDAGLDINLDGDDSPKDKKRKRKARKTRRMGRADARSITEPWKDSRVYRTMDMGLGAWNSEQGNERMLQRGAEIEEEGVRSGKKGFQRYGAGLQAASKGISSLQNPSELGGIGDAMSSVGHVVGQFGPMGKTAQGFLEMGNTVMKSVDRLKEWNQQLMEVNFKFAEYSSAMTQVQTEHEVRQIQLERERGDRRAGPARHQAEASDRLTRQMSGFEDAFGNVRSLVSTGITSIVTSVISATGLDVLGERLAQLTNLGGDNAPQGEVMTDWFDREVQSTDWAKDYGTPRAFRGP